MNLHKRALAALAALSLAVFVPVSLFASGYEFEGLGARQVSRAGASVADSDDWTGIYWNPASIPQSSRKERHFAVELFGGHAHAKDGNSLSSLVGPIFTKEKLDSPFLLGAVGAIMPIGQKGGLGFGFYTPLLQGADFEDTSSNGTHLDYESAAGILVWNVSGGYQITEKFSVGAGVNLLYGKINSDSKLDVVTPFPDHLTSKFKGDGTALEGMIGFRYDPTEKWSVGFIYRSGGDVKLEGPADATSNVLNDESTQFHFALRHPPTTGLGTAYRPSKALTFTLDFDQTYWHRFSNEIRYDQQGLLLANRSNTFDWRNTWKIRTGAKYVLSEKTELLGGYSFDRWGVDANSIDLATTIDVPMHRVSAGVSHEWRAGWRSTVGAIGGAGRRSENGVKYRVSGWQAMVEQSIHF